MKLHPRMLANSAFRVSKNAIGQSIHSLSYKMLKESPIFDIRKLSGKTVAIVGNAPINRKFGNEIDAHDIVIRCNKGVIPSYVDSELIGTKTDICLLGGISVLINRKVIKIINDNSNIQIIAPFSLDEKEVAMNALIAKLRFRDRINFLSRESMLPVRSVIPSGFRPSTGFVAMNLAMQSDTQSVDMYGFTFSDFNRIDQRSNQTVCHNFSYEKKIALALEEHGILSICR